MRLALLPLLATSGLLGCAPPKPQPWPEVRGVPAPETQRRTTQGELVGFVEPQGTHAWLGVPYAEPPVGPLRWRATRAGLPWEGLREGTRFGALCPQLNGKLSGTPPPSPRRRTSPTTRSRARPAAPARCC